MCNEVLSKINSISTCYRIKDFVNYLLANKGRAANTVMSYMNDLNLMLQFVVCSKNNIETTDENVKNTDISKINDEFIQSITKADLKAFILFLSFTHNDSANTRRHRISAIKEFYKFLCNEDIVENNIALLLELPKKETRNPIFLTIEESKKLLTTIQECETDKFKERNYCIILLFLSQGLRISELCNIKLTDIKRNTLTIIGKGNKQRFVYLQESCMKAIKSYLKTRNKREDRIRDKEYLFITRNNTQISTKQVEKMVSQYVELAGLSDKITPHKLRHTCATTMYTKGIDLLDIKETLGHSSLDTTQIYTHLVDEHRRNMAKINLYE